MPWLSFALREGLYGLDAIPDPVLRQYLPNIGPIPAQADFDQILILAVEAVPGTYHSAIHAGP